MTILLTHPANDSTFIRDDSQVAERQRQQIGPSDLGPGVCQECGSIFGMCRIYRETLIEYPLPSPILVFRYCTDPIDANFIWMKCAACWNNLNGFCAMGEAEYKAWLYEHPSAWDDRPERML